MIKKKLTGRQSKTVAHARDPRDNVDAKVGGLHQSQGLEAQIWVVRVHEQSNAALANHVDQHGSRVVVL
jgi:hypothetical protein